MLSNLVIFFLFYIYTQIYVTWFSLIPKNSNNRINKWILEQNDDWRQGSGRMHRIIYKNGRFAKKSGSPVSQLAHACCHAAVNTCTVLRACMIIFKACFVLDQTIISIVFLLTIVLFLFFWKEITFARIV